MLCLLPSRAVLKVAGPDAASFLQGLVTQDIEAARGGAVFAALLSPQGKILFEFILAGGADDRFLLDCRADSADALAKRLSLYRLRADVAIERLSDWRAVAACGGGVLEPPRDGVAFIDPRLGALGMRALAPAGSVKAEPAEGKYDRLRIDLGVPELGKDFAADEVFLLDVNYDALNAVSYKKGCFVGQETTSRMKRKGDVRKRTLMARFDGARPAKGTLVEAGDSTIGEILSGMDGAALALLRLDRLKAAKAAGMQIAAGGKPVRIEFPDYLEPA